MFRWLHRFIRKRMNPIDKETALAKKTKLSILYMILAWNALGMVAYLSFTGRKDWADYYGLRTEEEKSKPPAFYYAELLGIQKANVLHYKGFSKVGEYEYVAKENESK